MKKLAFWFTAVVLLASCTVQQPLYSWSRYDVASYNYLKNMDEKSTQELIANYQTILNSQEGTRRLVPPGICADYGFLLMQANRTQEGKQLLQKEMELYPESKVFIDRVLKMLEE